MANAVFLKTSMVDSTSQMKSLATVDVDGVSVTIEFWYDLIDQWGKEGVKQYLCAEALKATGNLSDALAVLSDGATGSIKLDKDGKVISDTRSWQQKWIDENPVAVAPVTPEIDPLV
jgi:hypothetical protein